MPMNGPIRLSDGVVELALDDSGGKLTRRYPGKHFAGEPTHRAGAKLARLGKLVLADVEVERRPRQAGYLKHTGQTEDGFKGIRGHADLGG